MRKIKLGISALAEFIAARLPFAWKTEFFRIFARVNGVKRAAFRGLQGDFEVPTCDRMIWTNYIAHGHLDKGTSTLLKTLFQAARGGTLIDVGANVGLICLPAKKDCPDIKVFAVEAHPENFKCLTLNAASLGIEGVHLHNRAAYSRNCTLEFEQSDDNAGDHRIRGGSSNPGKDAYDESKRSVIKVEAVTLDSLIPVAELSHPVIIKCDVQGAEGEVFKGARLLLEHVDMVLLEYWPYGLKRSGTDVDHFLSLFSSFRYGGVFDVLMDDKPSLISNEEVVRELKSFHASETGIKHLDVVFSKHRMDEFSEIERRNTRQI